MFGFLTPARRDETGPLANVAAADNFWRSLPRSDPLAAQKAICEALSDLVARKDLSREHLRALLALDQRSRSLADALLVNYVARNPQARSIERRYWRAAAELARAFAAAYSHFLRHLRNDPGARGWREYAPAVVLRLFRHRQVEFLLRPFLNDAPDAGDLGRAPLRLPVRGCPGLVASSRSRDRKSGHRRHREHAPEGVCAHPAARVDERRSVLAVRRVLALPLDSPLVCGGVAQGRPGRRRARTATISSSTSTAPKG